MSATGNFTCAWPQQPEPMKPESLPAKSALKQTPAKKRKRDQQEPMDSSEDDSRQSAPSVGVAPEAQTLPPWAYSTPPGVRITSESTGLLTVHVHNRTKIRGLTADQAQAYVRGQDISALLQQAGNEVGITEDERRASAILAGECQMAEWMKELGGKLGEKSAFNNAVFVPQDFPEYVQIYDQQKEIAEAAWKILEQCFFGHANVVIEREWRKRAQNPGQLEVHRHGGHTTLTLRLDALPGIVFSRMNPVSGPGGPDVVAWSSPNVNQQPWPACAEWPTAVTGPATLQVAAAKAQYGLRFPQPQVHQPPLAQQPPPAVYHGMQRKVLVVDYDDSVGHRVLWERITKDRDVFLKMHTFEGIVLLDGSLFLFRKDVKRALKDASRKGISVRACTANKGGRLAVGRITAMLEEWYGSAIPTWTIDDMPFGARRIEKTPRCCLLPGEPESSVEMLLFDDCAEWSRFWFSCPEITARFTRSASYLFGEESVFISRADTRSRVVVSAGCRVVAACAGSVLASTEESDTQLSSIIAQW